MADKAVRAIRELRPGQVPNRLASAVHVTHTHRRSAVPLVRLFNAFSRFDALDAIDDRCDRPFDAIDLTRIDDGRNVISFVSGDWSPHSTFGLRSAWSLLRAGRSQSTSMKHPLTGTVEEGRSRRETA